MHLNLLLSGWLAGACSIHLLTTSTALMLILSSLVLASPISSSLLVSPDILKVSISENPGPSVVGWNTEGFSPLSMKFTRRNVSIPPTSGPSTWGNLTAEPTSPSRRELFTTSTATAS